ncbi:DUF4132 domain-containing protein [Kitasatospora sp. NPDC004531]
MQNVAPAASRQPSSCHGSPFDEEFVLPASWRPLVLPRRGNAVPVPADWPGAEAVAAEDGLLAEHREAIARALASESHDPELIAAARGYLDGAADPLGAAVVPYLLSPGTVWDYAQWADRVDAWTARHGLAFAVHAAVLVLDVAYRHPRSGTGGEIRVVRQDTLQELHHLPHPYGAARWARHLLAVADEPAYLAARATLAELRTTPARRALAAHLLPNVTEWVDDCLAEEPAYSGTGVVLRTLLLAALGSRAQLDRLGQRPHLSWHAMNAGAVATLADGLGNDCVPLLAAELEASDEAAWIREQAERLLEFRTDEAFRALLSGLHNRHVTPVLALALRRDPVRGGRLLAVLAWGGSEQARQVLDRHLRASRSRLPEILAQLDAETAEFVRSLDGARPPKPVAGPAALPELLVTPPWAGSPKSRKPTVIAGLPVDEVPRLCWQEGEQESWAHTARFDDWWSYDEDTDWAAKAAMALDPRQGLWYACRLLHQGPVEVLAPLVEQWRPTDFNVGLEHLRPVLGKYGVAAAPVAVHAVRARPATMAPLLLPLLDVEAARMLADGLVRLKSVQAAARSWFARHGVAGALLLVPDALAKPGRARTAAEAALRLVAASDGGKALLPAVADRYGEAASAAIGAMLAVDPLVSALPARMPELPEWLDPAVLPQLLLNEQELALPESAVRHLLVMAALGRPDAPYPGLATVAAACRPDTLPVFAWDLFEEWRHAGMPAADNWTLTLLGEWGDDETARRLAPVLRDWPGQGANHRAVEGLEVLAAIGSDVALMQLNGIAQRVKFKALKTRAHEKIAEIAQGLGLTADQLADRLVPDLGLAVDATTVVDYGPRTFTVGFDDQLLPYVLDADGKRRKDLPAPAATDDAKLAAAERKRFTALKKDVRALATDQTQRLEAAMVDGRTWTAAEFRTLLVAHPLLSRLARRLVWSTTEGTTETDTEPGTETAFRLTADGTFTDVHDHPFALPEEAVVRLPHPLHLDVPAWTALFAKHQLNQPFPQLARPVAALTPDEADGHRLHRFEGAKVPAGTLLGLTKRGWQRNDVSDNGIERSLSRALPGDRWLSVTLDPGYDVGAVPGEAPEQTLQEVWLGTRPGDYYNPTAHHQRFADLDAVTVSELLTDLDRLTAG